MALPNYKEILEKDVFELLNVQNIPEEKRLDILESLYRTVENRTLIRLDDEIPEEAKEEWKVVIDREDATATDAFLKKYNIDIDRMILEESALLKTELALLLQEAATVKV